MILNNKKIILIASAGELTNILYNGILKEYDIEKVIIEDKSSTIHILKRGLKKFGLFHLIGQICFKIFVLKVISFNSKKRKKELFEKYELSNNPIHNNKIINIKSINDEKSIQLLQTLNPDLILVSGTRIISKKNLSAMNVKFINLHAGITPMYRGVHGAYWALINQDKENCGVTIHFIDEGIDTGEILAQGIIHPSANDNFYTYPYLQYALGINLIKNVIQQYCNGNIVVKEKSKEKSFLWNHPTAWNYIYYFLFKGVK